MVSIIYLQINSYITIDTKITLPRSQKVDTTLFNSLPNKKIWNIFGKFHIYGWLKVSSITWHQKSENNLCLGEQWWALVTFVKGMKIRLRKNWLPILAEQEVPRRRNCRWSDEFIINYDRYGFVLYMTCPTSCPHSTQPHPTPPHSTTYTVTSPRTPSNTTTINKTHQ